MHEEILLPATKKLIKNILPDLFPLGTYLAGGTAIALQIGHRRSADLDFFTPGKFVESSLEEKFKEYIGFKLIKRDWQTLIGVAKGVKFSFFYYPYPLISKTSNYKSLSLASLPDLAAMKLETIIGRGTRRDLIDIYFLAMKFGFKKILNFYQQKYKNFKEREVLLKKALVYFDEAEGDEMPDMIIPVDWEKVKGYLTTEVKNINLL